MTVEHHHSESTGLHNRRHAVRSVLELVQDLIVLGLCAGLFAAMLIKLVHLGQSLVRGTDFSPGAGRHHVYSGSDRVVSPVADLSGRASDFGFYHGRGRYCGYLTRGSVNRSDASRLEANVGALRIHSYARRSSPIRRRSNTAIRRLSAARYARNHDKRF